LKILFVCTGNICRSPTGEVVLRQLAQVAKIPMTVASAGISSWHQGQGADARTAETAADHGYDLSRHRARAVRTSDFREFDRILAMDRSHLKALHEMAPKDCTAEIVLFLPTYLPSCGLSDVPDPYYGGAEGFEDVLALLEDGCHVLLKEMTPSAT
jgi:protein-tyrosine phosphatase